ncbi:MAG: hypothetical protein JWQ27_2328 [Ferruginibacter sp.]|nr:hypothetical protein [Ferruginibacter sp.]
MFGSAINPATKRTLMSLRLLLICLIITPAIPAFAQVDTARRVSKASEILPPLWQDSTFFERFKIYNLSFDSVVGAKKIAILNRLKDAPKSLPHLSKSETSLNPFSVSQGGWNMKRQKEKSFLQLSGGQVNYSFFYRSRIDTPFAEQNIYQHQVNSSVGLTVLGFFPLRFNSQVRRSNSFLFRDITDFQLEYDAGIFRNKLSENIARQLNIASLNLEDTLVKQWAQIKAQQFIQLNNIFKTGFTAQRLWKRVR